ncbi:SRPBCC family protein [Paenibacillus sp. SC116]|uniref:SRPBCC family protein n=1 Tax=Paenibacillus sp. SC116 TaxID=2968986 RepID=UPI00215AB6F2|nr:SRPBCC family protein [Paenibacillus sp. SC116]MCR8846350.1 SRPBCC family protein [Paenibacillus sp. SC116]
MNISISMDIAAPKEMVFESYVRDSHVMEWSEFVVEYKFNEEEDRERVKVGATYTRVEEYLGRFVDIQSKIMEYEPNRRVTVKGACEDWEVWTNFQLEQHEPGVMRVTLTHTREVVSLWDRVSSLVTRWVLRRQLKQELTRLKAFVERRYQNSLKPEVPEPVEQTEGDEN